MKTKKKLPGEIVCDEAYYARIKEIQESIRNGTHQEVKLNKGGTLL